MTVGDALDVARRARTVRLADTAREAIDASRRLKEGIVAREAPIYGVTTGFGDSAHRQISPEKTAGLQRFLLRGLGAGPGPWRRPM